MEFAAIILSCIKVHINMCMCEEVVHWHQHHIKVWHLVNSVSAAQVAPYRAHLSLHLTATSTSSSLTNTAASVFTSPEYYGKYCLLQEW